MQNPLLPWGSGFFFGVPARHGRAANISYNIVVTVDEDTDLVLVDVPA